MKKIIIQITLTAALVLFLSPFIEPILAGETGIQQETGLLWKIEGKGKGTSYVFGTFHLINKADFNLGQEVKTALKESDKLFLELDMDDPQLQQKMMQYAAMKGDFSLKTMLSEEEYAEVDKKVTSVAGVGLVAFDKMKPFIVSSMIIPSIIGEEVVSYEMALMQLVKEQGKDVEGLETVQFQMSIFDKIPYEQQAGELAELVMEQEMVDVMFAKMVENYKAGDIESLRKVVEDYYDEEEYVKWLLDERNENWAEIIDESSGEESNFYAVGAGHLGGEMGLLNLLREKGYTVTPVN